MAKTPAVTAPAVPYDESSDIFEEAEALTAAPKTASQDALNERMVAAIEALAQKNATGPTPQIPFAQAKHVTPWNPTGTRKRMKFTRPTFINGRKIGELMHTDAEIEKLNALKPGHYHNRKIVVWSSDTSDGLSTINLQFPNKTPEQKMELMRLTAGKNGLEGILDIVLAEQSAVVLAR